MNRPNPGILIVLLMAAVLMLSAGAAFAAKAGAASPELATKKEMVRQQQAQRITQDKRQAAAEALKAERTRVYNAKQAGKKAAPVATDKK